MPFDAIGAPTAPLLKEKGDAGLVGLALDPLDPGLLHRAGFVS